MHLIWSLWLRSPTCLHFLLSRCATCLILSTKLIPFYPNPSVTFLIHFISFLPLSLTLQLNFLILTRIMLLQSHTFELCMPKKKKKKIKLRVQFKPLPQNQVFVHSPVYIFYQKQMCLCFFMKVQSHRYSNMWCW